MARAKRALYPTCGACCASFHTLKISAVTSTLKFNNKLGYIFRLRKVRKGDRPKQHTSSALERQTGSDILYVSDYTFSMMMGATRKELSEGSCGCTRL